MAKGSTFSLSSRGTALVVAVLGIWSVARAESTDLVPNSLRRGSGEVNQPKRTNRIINGDIVEDLRFPYFSLMIGDGMCGGVLIAPQLVLSAAHCDGNSDLFRIGAYDGYMDGHHVTIRSTIKHPKYDMKRFVNDIMIFKLEETADFSYITLEKDAIRQGKFTVVGFGDTDKGQKLDLPGHLREVELEYVDNDICDKGHGGRGEVTEDMMCVAGKDKDACLGDSGGPLIKKGNSIEKDRLIGLVSWGRECAEEGAPGVYARISYFYDWIVETVCDNFPEDSPPYMECTTPDEMDRPSAQPTNASTNPPRLPTEMPTRNPTFTPTHTPTRIPTRIPTPIHTPIPTGRPTMRPTLTQPTNASTNPPRLPTEMPTQNPTFTPTHTPTRIPTPIPTSIPTGIPTRTPTPIPTGRPPMRPTLTPTRTPTSTPTSTPNFQPTFQPTLSPTFNPTSRPTNEPTITRSQNPTPTGSFEPSISSFPSVSPSISEQTRTGPASSSSSLDSDSFLIPCLLHSIYGILSFVILL